jgi:hypothetical protein
MHIKETLKAEAGNNALRIDKTKKLERKTATHKKYPIG